MATPSGSSRVNRLASALRAAGRWITETPSRRVWALVAMIWAIAVPSALWIIGLDGFDFGLRIRWWHLAIGFYLAEIVVVHLQFRKDAHTFSMSEVPIVLGLIFATPVAMLAGQMVGSFVALTAHRKQRRMKLIFNMGQLALQTVLAVAIFRLVAAPSLALDIRTTIAAVLACLCALFVGHITVFSAIRASGGQETVQETTRVFAVTSIGTIGASLLAMVAAIVLVLAPQLGWLGFAPVVLVFVAYRAYVAQTEDKDRVAALFDAATALHRSPQIDRAVVAVAERVLDLVKAESAAVLLLPNEHDPTAYLTSVGADGTSVVMAPEGGWQREDFWALSEHSKPVVLPRDRLDQLANVLGRDDVREAVVVTLTVSGEPVGLLAGINRVGDVSAFEDADARVLATLGSQLSTSLENGRLTETLSEIRQLKEQLESLLESKDRLVASVSHELRTPLTGVIGLTELIREAAGDSLDEETSEMLDLVVEQGNELSNIIEDLLVHARAEAGTLTVRHEAFDLVAEAHTVAASHNLTDPIGPPAAHVLGDPLRVRQVLRNLITNARRYGGSTITVEIARRGDFYAASVVDDGSGVPPGAAETIFEPYRSAHDSVGQPGSVGIGLALSRSMAQLMGGDLTYSRTDGLTRFTLRVQAETPLRSDSMVLQGASDLGTVRR